ETEEESHQTSCAAHNGNGCNHSYDTKTHLSALLNHTGKSAECHSHQSGCYQNDSGAAEGTGDIVKLDLLTDTRHNHNRDGKSDCSGKTVYDAFQNIVSVCHVV